MSEHSTGIALLAYRPDWENLRSYIESIHEELQPDELIVELDGESYENQQPPEVSVFSTPERRGEGAAISHGFDLLDTEVLVFVDSDASVPPSSINAVLDSLQSGLVTGYHRAHRAAVSKSC